MAEQDITMLFKGEGDLLPFLKNLRDNVNGLREDSGKTQAAITSDLKKSTDQTIALTGATKKLNDEKSKRPLPPTPPPVPPEPPDDDAKRKREEAIQQLVKLGASYQQAAFEVDNLAKRTAFLASAQRDAGDEADTLFDSLRQLVEEGAKTPDGAKALARELTVAEKSTLDMLVATKSLTEEQAALVGQALKLNSAFDGAVDTAESLRTRLSKAKQEAFEIGEKFGTGSAQFAAAAAKAGKIADEIDHINKVVDAFNPGKKLAAVLQLGEGAVGAFTAINAVVSAIGGDSEETEKALKRVEQGVGFLIGAQSAIRGFTEGWASLKAILGGLTEVEKETEAVTNAVAIAQQRAAAAARSKAAASEAAALATRAQTAAEEQAAIASEALLAAQASGLSVNEALAATKAEQAAASEAAAIAEEQQVVATEALNLANKASISATEADIVAKEEQAVASAEAAGATGLLSGALNGLKTALLENPLTAILVLLAAATVAMIKFASGTEEARKNYKELVDEINSGFNERASEIALANARKQLDAERERGVRLGEIEAGKRKDAEMTAREQESERKANKVIDDEVIYNLHEQQKARLAAFLELTNAFNKVVDKFGAFKPDASATELKRLTELLGLDAEATAAEITAAFQKANDERVIDARDAQAQIAGIEEKALAEGNDRREKELAEIKANAAKAKAIREQLADQIAAIEKQLADKIRELTVSGADPRERLKLEREAGEEGIALLEKNLRREIALREIGAAKLIDLSEKEKIALADARIAEGGGKLSTKQDEAFANAKFLLWQEYFKKVSDLEVEFDQDIADASSDAQARELAALDKLLAERAKKLKDAGATPAQIEEDAQRQTLIVQTKFAKDRIDRETQTQVDILEAQLSGGELSVAQERALQIAILEEKIKGAEKALAIIEDNGSDIAKAEIASAKNVIAKLKGELRNLTDDIKPFKLSDLFNLEGEDAARFNDAAKSLVASAFDIVGQLNEADQARIDAQIDATDQLIEDYQRRGDELQAQLEKDQEANAKGLANNLDGTLKAIADNKAAEEKALADKKRLVAEKQKLAKQQAIADTIQQSSSLLTAATSIFKEGALVPGGIFVAIGIVASMVASFLALKNKMASITAQPLWKGTKSVELNGAPDGVDTVPAMLTRRERVIDVETSDRHRTLYDGLQDKDASAVRRGLLQTADQYGLTPDLVGDAIANLTPKQLAPILAQIDLTPLLAEHGITVREESVRSVVTMNSTHKERIEKAQAVSMAGMERRLDVLTAEVKSFRKQEADRPEAFTLPDGTLMIETPHMVRYIAPHR